MGNVGGMMEENVFVLSLKIYLSSALFSAVVDTLTCSTFQSGLKELFKKMCRREPSFQQSPIKCPRIQQVGEPKQVVTPFLTFHRKANK